jgi:hypothetical protein
MKTFRNMIIALATLTAGFAIASCSDANDYEDANTDNPSWITNYTDSTAVPHPESLAGTKWVRGTGLKKNAYGEDVQGFVESLDFVSADSVSVKMSQGATAGTMGADDSNNEKLPLYEYSYSDKTGAVQILQRNVNKGTVTKKPIFVGVAVSGTQEVITIVHYGDTPAQTYLVKQY